MNIQNALERRLITGRLLFTSNIKELIRYHTHIKSITPTSRYSRKRVRHRLRAYTQRLMDGAFFAPSRRREERALLAVTLRRDHGRQYGRVHRTVSHHSGEHAQTSDD